MADNFSFWVFSGRSEEYDKTKNIQTEIDATKKEAQKEMERNETLEQLKQRIVESVNRLDKQRECLISFQLWQIVLEIYF